MSQGNSPVHCQKETGKKCRKKIVYFNQKLWLTRRRIFGTIVMVREKNSDVLGG